VIVVRTTSLDRQRRGIDFVHFGRRLILIMCLDGSLTPAQ